MYEQKQYQFDQATQAMLFQKAVPSILHNGVQFEGLPITLLQTEQIVNNSLVSGMKFQDMLVVHNMHEGAQYISQHYAEFNFEHLKQLHALVGRTDAPNPGEIRKNAGGVATTRGTFVPDWPDEQAALETVNWIIYNEELRPETRAAKLFAYLSRAQLFNDTNKRTALLAANVPLLQHGAGVFYIPEAAMENVLQIMGEYYWSNDDRLLIAVLEEIAISDYDGKSFYDPAHQYRDNVTDYQKFLNKFKGLNAKGLLGKERWQALTTPLN